MHVVTWLQAGSAAALFLWVLLIGAALVDRWRFEELERTDRDELDLLSRDRLFALASGRKGDDGQWYRGGPLVRLVERGDPDAERLAREALRGDDPERRYAAVTALGAVAPHEDWAVDLLLEALAEGRERAARVAAALDLAAPRAGPRLVPLLGHPSPVVRFWAVRLLARYPELRRSVLPLSHDPNAQVRAAVLELLRRTARSPGDPAALRVAVERLDDRPTVRLQAVRATAEIGHADVAPLLVRRLGDPSWWVRRAAEQSLVELGTPGAVAAAEALGSPEPEVRRSAARVLQETGVVDGLVANEESELLERVFAAGDGRVRRTAEMRAERVAP